MKGFAPIRVQHLAGVVNGFPFDSERFDTSGGYPLLRIRDVGANTTELRYVGDFVEAARVVPGDVVIGMDGDFKVGKWLGVEDALLNQRVALLRTDDVTARFLHYALPRELEAINAVTYATTVKHLSASQILHAMVPWPGPEIAAAVVSFLDCETAKIDALIAKQHDLVTVLRDRRESAVMAAVTGEGSSAPKRDSGVRWIGGLPKHWQVGNIRRYAAMHSGHTPSRQVPQYWEDCTVPWFTLADVWQLRDDTRTHLGETSEMISELGLRHSAAELLPAGTVALSRTASVGFSGIMPVPMATSQDFWNWVCGPDLLPEFLLRVFRAMRREMRSLMAGSTHQTIYKTDAASFVIPVPPLDEQRTIVDRLEEELRQMDRLVDRATVLVQLLQERRAALITAAVTGSLDVTTYGKGG